MEATYTVNVDDGRTVEMTGPVDALDKITAQMRSANDPLHEAAPALLEALKKFVATWDPAKGRNQREKLDVARRMALMAIAQVEPSSKCPECGNDDDYSCDCGTAGKEYEPW